MSRDIARTFLKRAQAERLRRAWVELPRDPRADESEDLNKKEEE